MICDMIISVLIITEFFPFYNIYIYIYKQFKNRFPSKLFIEIKRLMQNIRKESKYDFVL